MFGDNANSVQAKVADKSGLDLGMVTKLLPMLAPLVMGYLGRKAKAGALDASGLASELSGEADGLDLGDFGDLLGGDAGGLVGGILNKVKDALSGD